MAEQANVIGYYVYEGNLCAEAVYVIVDDGAADTYTRYNAVEGVSEVPKHWIDLAFRITMEQFLEATVGYEVPLKYL